MIIFHPDHDPLLKPLPSSVRLAYRAATGLVRRAEYCIPLLFEEGSHAPAKLIGQLSDLRVCFNKTVQEIGSMEFVLGRVRNLKPYRFMGKNHMNACEGAAFFTEKVIDAIEEPFFTLKFSYWGDDEDWKGWKEESDRLGRERGNNPIDKQSYASYYYDEFRSYHLLDKDESPGANWLIYRRECIKKLKSSKVPSRMLGTEAASEILRVAMRLELSQIEREPDAKPLQNGIPGNPANPADLLKPASASQLAPADRKAYFAFLYAELKRDQRLEDHEAYSFLKDVGISDGNAELNDYKIPAFDTWTRQLRNARKTLGEQKYNRRAGRSIGKSIVRKNENE